VGTIAPRRIARNPSEISSARIAKSSAARRRINHKAEGEGKRAATEIGTSRCGRCSFDASVMSTRQLRRARLPVDGSIYLANERSVSINKAHTEMIAPRVARLLAESRADSSFRSFDRFRLASFPNNKHTRTPSMAQSRARFSSDHGDRFLALSRRTRELRSDESSDSRVIGANNELSSASDGRSERNERETRAREKFPAAIYSPPSPSMMSAAFFLAARKHRSHNERVITDSS